MDLRSEQMAERRERILAAARDLIAEGGYEALTMRELARRARVTVPTVYNLVGGKQALLADAVTEQTERFIAAVERDPGDPVAGLVSLADAVGRELLRVPHYYRSLLRLLFSADSTRDVRADVGRTLVDEFERGLAELADAGGMEDWVDPRSAARALTGQLMSLSLEWTGGDIPDARLRPACVYATCLLLLGLAKGRARRAFRSQAERAQRESRGGRRPSAQPRSARRP